MSRASKATLLIVLMVGLSIWLVAVAAQTGAQEATNQRSVDRQKLNTQNEIHISRQADDAIDTAELTLSPRTDLTPTASYSSFLPLVTTPPPITNGDFELGPVAWGTFSSNGWPLILDSSELLVPAHSGSWAVWMGGDLNEDAILWQLVKVPTSDAILRYWHWIASEDVCDNDVAGVAINLDEVVDAFWLCDDNNTGGWVERSVDLGLYAGQTVELDFVAFTNGSLNSNVFIDDVSLGNTSKDFDDVGLSEYGTPGSSSTSKQPRATRLAPYRADNVFGQGLQEIRRAINARLSEG